MNESALIGCTGFVGSNLLRQHAFTATYNSRNIESITGRHFELLVFAGAQAKKWWANDHPDEDWAGISKALAALQHVTAEHVILVSTVDVVSELHADERCRCQPGGLCHYGRNRLLLEQALQDQFDKVTIIRLPGLFGRGLKKNVVFDLLNNHSIDRVQPESSYQYYDLDDVWRDIETVRGAAVHLMHFATEPIRTKEILDRFFSSLKAGASADPPVCYDFRTMHAGLFGRSDGYMRGKTEILEKLGRFIRAYQGASP